MLKRHLHYANNGKCCLIFSHHQAARLQNTFLHWFIFYFPDSIGYNNHAPWMQRHGRSGFPPICLYSILSLSFFKNGKQQGTWNHSLVNLKKWSSWSLQGSSWLQEASVSGIWKVTQRNILLSQNILEALWPMVPLCVRNGLKVDQTNICNASQDFSNYIWWNTIR